MPDWRIEGGDGNNEPFLQEDAHGVDEDQIRMLLRNLVSTSLEPYEVVESILGSRSNLEIKEHRSSPRYPLILECGGSPFFTAKRLD